MTANARSTLVSDGKVVENAGVEMSFDGQVMDVEGFSNDERFYAQLDHNDIMELLAIKANPTSLEKRLEKDYGVSLRGNRSSRRKGRKSGSRRTKKSRSGSRSRSSPR